MAGDQESDGSDGDSDNSCELDTDNSPKDVPVARLGERLGTRRIVINISDTQYPIIEEVAEEMGWLIQRTAGKGDWDLWWTDHEVQTHTLFRMHLFQKINHYPNMYVIARKNLLGLSLMAMRQKCPQQYNFFPQTWILPQQFSQLRQDIESRAEGKARTYIVKPQALSQGRGIFLTRSLQDVLNGRRYVVQRYLKQPLLLDGLKFDLRLYVLVGSTDPLRLYFYSEGMARFATEPYAEPNEDNLNKSFVHLTNYNLNKANPKYQHGKEGHKRTASSVFERLRRMGHDVTKLQCEIEQVLLKTIIAGLPNISHAYLYCQPEDYEGNMCFHVLGCDVLLTRDLKPLVLEVNHTPSFSTSTPLDYDLKKGLIRDTFNLLRANSARKVALFKRTKLIAKHRLETGERHILKGKSREQCIAKSQSQRDQLEEGLLGGYRVIYPPKSAQLLEKYQLLLRQSVTVNKELSQIRNHLISQDKEKAKLKEKKKQKKQIKQSHKPQINKGDKKQINIYQDYCFKNKIQESTKNVVVKIQAEKKIQNFRTKVARKEHCADPHYVKYVDSIKKFNELMLRNAFKNTDLANSISAPQGDAYALLKIKNSVVRDSRHHELKEKDNPQHKSSHKYGCFVKPKNYRLIGEGIEIDYSHGKSIECCARQIYSHGVPDSSRVPSRHEYNFSLIKEEKELKFKLPL